MIKRYVFLLLILLVSCTPKEQLINKSVSSDKGVVVGSDEMIWDESRFEVSEECWERLLSFEEVVSLSDNIVIGKAVGKRVSNCYEYTFEVHDVLKGELQTEVIHVYENNSSFTRNGTYILYLEKYKSPYYDHIVYNTVFNTFHKLDNEKLASYSSADNSNKVAMDTLSDLIDFISNTPDTSNYSHDAAVVHTDSDDFQEIIDISEYIIEIKAVEEVIVAEKVILMRCEVKHIFKGKIDEELIIFLPSDAEVGEQYLVTLNESDSSYMISSRHGFINVKDAKYDDAVDLLMDD